MSRTKGKSSDQYKVLSGTCPDEKCQAKLYFPAFDKSVECTGCGQRHDRASLQNVEEVTNTNIALHNLLKNVLLGNVKPQKGPENVKVLGLSNYVCKLLSPILTHYGMDKQTGKAKLLTKMGQAENFDCGVLGDRAFQIDPEHLSVMGYGRDRSGSLHYLADTLNVIKEQNESMEVLVPIHADGDGHCLVHAVSRALVGRELFWHALRVNLFHHFRSNLDQYKQLFKDFIDQDEWNDIIEECDPDFIPPDYEPLGLRNIHVFGLANVLKRPIILLDSLSGMQSSGDYSGVFLPALVAPEKCQKDGTLNKPLCIAWSSCGRNHFIPLVGIKGNGPARLHRYMIQRAWGIPDTHIDKYIEFDSKGMCVIGGDKSLKDQYIQRLVSAMEDVFLTKYGVHPSLVADVHQYVYKTSGIVGAKLDTVLHATQSAVQENRLYRCLMCDAITQYHIPADWFQNGGSLYNLAVQSHGELRTDKKYSFPLQGAICTYDKKRDVLVLDAEHSKLSKCAFCRGERVRRVKGDGSVQYQNGDQTLTLSTSTRCTCGFKHYWNGKEYDNFPEILPVTLEWNDRSVKEEVAWFQYESDVTLNSNVYEVAQNLVQKHFPGEFGSERLVQKVVDKILRQTAVPEAPKEVCTGRGTTTGEEAWSPDSPSKIIITGQQQKSVHKEELTKSETEKMVRHRIETNAAKQQQKKTSEQTRSSSQSSSPISSPRRTPQVTPEKKTLPRETPSSAAASSVLTSQSADKEKKLRLATSDGRQVMLALKEDVTFAELQKLILEAVDVPPERQKIRVGFPPRELKAPADSEEKIVSLQHGDKISLEILAAGGTQNPVSVRGHGDLSESSPQKGAWSMFDENIPAPTAESLIESLKTTQNAGADSIDMSITSLAMIATLSGKDLWTYAQSNPHLFSVGGLFYKQVERDLGLAEGKHCTLPALPGKVFRYSASADRLEICLEPHGHFSVEPDIERKVKAAASAGTDESMEVKFGSSGAICRGERGHVAFQGQGHSLRSTGEDIRMPTDLPESVHRIGARRLQNFCDPVSHQESIKEETDEGGPLEDLSLKSVEMLSSGQGQASGDTSIPPIRQKIGPGFSIVNPATTNAANENVEMFRQLAEAIEKTVADCSEFSESATTSPGSTEEEKTKPRKDDTSAQSSLLQTTDEKNTSSEETMDTS